jgi:8-oxo-dGTP pyrophosphatase MutT (NUDIX family)
VTPPSLAVDEALLRDAVARSSRRHRGDHDLNPGFAPAGPLRRAAVLCPVVRRPEGLSVVLTLRPTTMRAHAGQIALPGGKVDRDDVDAQAAALREAHEEIGLPPERVDMLGALARYRTRTGYAITPFVGLVEGDFTPRPEPGEVADVFETPLDFLMDLARHQRHTRRFQGVDRAFWAMPWGERFIWGATAGILRMLAEDVAAARAAREAAATPSLADGAA